MANNKYTLGVTLLAAVIAASGCKEQKTADDYLSSAARFLQQEQLEKARVEFRNALAVDGQNAAAHYGLAMVAKHKEDHSAREFHLAQATALDPNHVQAQVELGEVAVLVGDISTAAGAAQALSRLQPQSLEFYRLSAAVAIARQQWQAAEDVLAQGLAGFEASSDLWGLKGVLAKKREQWSDALTALDRAIELADDDLQYRLLRVEVNQLRGDFSATVADLTALIGSSKQPQAQIIQLIKLIHQRDGAEAAIAVLTDYIAEYPDAYALQTLHVDLLKPEKPERAGDLLDQYIEQAQDPTGLRFYRVYAALANNHADIAKQDLLAILQGSPGDKAQAEANALLAELAWLEGDVPATDKRVKKALAINSVHEGALLLQAKVLLQQGRGDEAVVYLNKLLSRDASSVAALELLAAHYQQQGKAAFAADFYNRILQVQPSHYRALQFKVAEDFSKGHLTNTDASLARALQYYPEDAALLSIKLQVAALRERFDEAEALLQKLSALDVNQADILFFRGFIEQKQNRHQQALALFGEAVNARGHFDKALLAMNESARAISALPELTRFLRNHTQAVPSHRTAQLMLAQLLARDDLQEAIEVLQKSVAGAPAWVAGATALADLYRRANRGDDAFDLLRTTYNNTDDAGAGIAYAQQLEARGEATEAALVYEKLLQRYPDNLVVRNNYASLLVGELNSSQSIRKAMQLSESFAGSNSPALLDTYGSVLSAAGKHSEALFMFNKALTIAEVPAIRLHLAEALYAAGKNDEARRTLGELNEEALGDEFAAQVQVLKTALAGQ